MSDSGVKRIVVAKAVAYCCCLAQNLHHHNHNPIITNTNADTNLLLKADRCVRSPRQGGLFFLLEPCGVAVEYTRLAPAFDIDNISHPG